MKTLITLVLALYLSGCAYLQPSIPERDLYKVYNHTKQHPLPPERPYDLGKPVQRHGAV